MVLGKQWRPPPLRCHACKSICASSFLHIGDYILGRQVSGPLTDILPSSWRLYLNTFSFISYLSGSISVPSVTVVAVASWVRGVCKYSVSHLSLKHSSATRTEEARRVIAVMVIRTRSQKRLEREQRQSKTACLMHK